MICWCDDISYTCTECIENKELSKMSEYDKTILKTYHKLMEDKFEKNKDINTGLIVDLLMEIDKRELDQTIKP